MNKLTTQTPTLSAPTRQTRHYNVLSIGTRGVGKTVFFVGHYDDCLESSLSSLHASLNFECDDAETQETIDKIHNYIVQNEEYPPATMKITNFDFQVQLRTNELSQSLGRVCWWDTPGESCQLYNPAFLTMLVNMDGSCLFLDAQQLRNCADDPDALQAQQQPINDLVDLLHHNHLNYPIAIVITKCGLLKGKTDWQILRQCLRPLIKHLDELDLNYRLFYSEIPIVKSKEGAKLQLTGKDNALVWLVTELQAKEANASSLTPMATVNQETEDIKSIKAKNSIKRSIFTNILQKRPLIISFILMTTALSVVSVFLIDRAVNSEQENSNFVPTQSL